MGMHTWGKTREQLELKTYPDCFWESAYCHLFDEISLSGGSARALAPEKYSHPTIDIYQEAREPSCYQFVLFHKGMGSYLDSFIIQRLSRFEVIYENDVFALMKLGHKDGVAQQRALELQASCCGGPNIRLAFLHVPKTAGTALVNALRQILTNVRYVDSPSDLEEYPGYSGVCGHFYLSDFAPLSTSFDCVFSLLRDPLERFLSAVAHCRRKSEHPSTLSPTMRAMRELSLIEFLKTREAIVEINAFSFYFGWEDPMPLTDLHSIRENAMMQLSRNSIVLFRQENLSDLALFLEEVFDKQITVNEFNTTEEPEALFSAAEKAFILSDLPAFFESERRFIEQLSGFIYSRPDRPGVSSGAATELAGCASTSKRT